VLPVSHPGVLRASALRPVRWPLVLIGAKRICSYSLCRDVCSLMLIGWSVWSSIWSRGIPPLTASVSSSVTTVRIPKRKAAVPGISQVVEPRVCAVAGWTNWKSVFLNYRLESMSLYPGCLVGLLVMMAVWPLRCHLFSLSPPLLLSRQNLLRQHHLVFSSCALCASSRN
jgi:hypothetical protein